jgi:large subunit ribosomal protein L29
VTLEEIRGLATDELGRAVESTREELFKARFAAQAESVENTAKMRDLRRRVARMKTVIRERELAAAKGS